MTQAKKATMTNQAEAIQRETDDNEGHSIWAIETLDLEAYFARLDYSSPTGASVESLRALHRAHTAAIPFENLDILLGRGISLELRDIQHKLVKNRRGGYCFEQNLLFGAALERLSFPVTRLAARVAPEKPGPRTHVCLVVEAGRKQWLADVGFGTTLLEPVELRDGVVTEQGVWTYGISSGEQDSWLLRSRDAGTWATEYAFTTEPQYPIDYIVHNHYTSTHPGSPFVNQIVALRKTDTTQYALRGRTLSIENPGNPTETCIVSDDELGAVLQQTFGIELQPEDLEALISAG